MSNKPTITIGIPAYNEENTIGDLLHDLLSQKTPAIHIDRIIVVSDASTDRTNTIVSSINNTRIQLLINKNRSGQMKSQNRILRECTSDILVLINADVRIPDTKFLEKITLPIREKGVDLTSVRVTPVTPNGIFEHILHVSAQMKQDFYEQHQNGRNIYTCHGRARAFSKGLYRQLRFTNAIAEDAFSYLFCCSSGLMYQYIPTTSVYYRLPTSFSDHVRQSVRFLQSREQLYSSFSPQFVEQEYHLPSEITRTVLLRYLRRKPLPTISYILLFMLMNLLSQIKDLRKATWEVSTSSKHITPQQI